MLAPIVGLAYFVIQLLMKNAQAETNGLIREHIAGDTQKHSALDAHLVATDRRVDRLETKIFD